MSNEKAIDITQADSEYENLIVSRYFILWDIFWSEGVIDCKVGMCSPGEILALFMRNRYHLNNMFLHTKNKNVLD